MYKLKFRHFIFLLILESSNVNTTKSSSLSDTWRIILGIVLFLIFISGCLVCLFGWIFCLCFLPWLLIKYILTRKWFIRQWHVRPRHNSSTETVPLAPITCTIPLHSKRLPHEALRAAEDKNDPDISEMSHNSSSYELLLVDDSNKVVRAIRVRDNTPSTTPARQLRDVYRAPPDTSPSLCGVCHMSGSDTLLVSSIERGTRWLVALRRNDSEWREAQRVQTDVSGHISGPLNGSQVLIGEWNSKRMELFHVESGPRIARVHLIDVPEEYAYFSSTCDSDTFVAMTYRSPDNSVRVHRLVDDRLEEIARIGLKEPSSLLWLADRLFVADFDREKLSHAVIELEVSDTRLERRRELIATSEKINVRSLCAVNDGLAIFNSNSKDILLIFKEVQWQLLQQSLGICELEDSLEKGKNLNSSQRKTPHADKEESTTEMYIIVHCTVQPTS